MGYVDGFVLPIPTENIPAYRKLARMAAKVWREHGALDYHECIGEDLQIPGMLPFPKMTKAGENETVVFAWISYKSRRHRDQVNKKVMADPRMAKMCDEKNMPFNVKRMAYGGFKTLVSL